MLQNSDLFLNAVEKDSLDLAFQSSGIDQCVCGNIFGPRIRRYYLIHFVLDGFGVLQIEEWSTEGNVFEPCCGTSQRSGGHFLSSVSEADQSLY